MNNKKTYDYIPWPEVLASKYRTLGYWSDENLAALLVQGATASPQNIAMIDEDKSWTYAELYTNAKRLASGLQSIGLRQGMTAVIHMPNCGQLFEIFFALQLLGVAPVLALANQRYNEIAYFCKHVDADAYFCNPNNQGFDYSTLSKQLSIQFPSLKVIVNGGCDNGFNLREIRKIGESKSQSFDAEDANSIALFQLSGGTTGTPKLIPRTHNDYYYSIRASALLCGLTHTSVYLAVLPVVHNFTLTSPGALGTLWAGGTVVLAKDGSPDTAFPLIKKHKVSITAVVPPLAITWAEAAERLKLNGIANTLDSLAVLQIGGSKLSKEAASRIEPTLGCEIQQVFGMAEGLVNYTRPGDKQTTRLETQGKPLSTADEILIVDDNDQPLMQGQRGHLLTRGPYTIRGYYRAAEHNRKAFTEDGFYRTGDIVRQDEDGYLIVEDRAKDQINRGGEKISAEELENHFLAHPDIKNAALVAVPDAYLGERSCAYIELKNTDKRMRKIDLMRFISERQIASYKIPDRIEFINELPKTKLGKINKNQLRKQASVL